MKKLSLLLVLISLFATSAQAQLVKTEASAADNVESSALTETKAKKKKVRKAKKAKKSAAKVKDAEKKSKKAKKTRKPRKTKKLAVEDEASSSSQE